MKILDLTKAGRNKKSRTLVEFADEHGLTLEIHSRELPGLPPFYSKFSNVEVSKGAMLHGTFGNGESVKQARRKNRRR